MSVEVANQQTNTVDNGLIDSPIIVNKATEDSNADNIDDDDDGPLHPLEHKFVFISFI